MKRALLIMIISLICGLATAGAEVIEVPLAPLHGTYADINGVIRGAFFDLGSELPWINSVSIRLSGESVVGIVYCEDGGPDPWPIEFTATIRDTGYIGYWHAGLFNKFLLGISQPHDRVERTFAIRREFRPP